jgi:serine/threonine-protein kinase CTR1
MQVNAVFNLYTLHYAFPQVVAAVGFKGRRLEIPIDLNPQVAALIEACWAKYVFHPYWPSYFPLLS